jgi:hypothetical protein
MVLGTSHLGFPVTAWQTAKQEARNIMIQRARLRGTIAYSDLVQKLTAIQLDAHDARVGNLLGEISEEEDQARRGMLSVVVVHKTGDMKPGPGFFELAAHLGRDTSDTDVCWIDELNKVFVIWAGHS